MKPNMQVLESLRIYSDRSLTELFMKLLTWRICQTSSIVENAEHLVRFTRSIGLEVVSNSLIKASLGSTFIGGSNIHETVKMARKINAKGIGVCYDFGCEGSSGASEIDLDKNSDMFIQAVEAAALVRNNSMGLKYSGLMVTELLRRLNGIANTLKAMFDAGVEPGKPFVSSSQKMKEFIAKRHPDLSKEDINSFFEAAKLGSQSVSLAHYTNQVCCWNITDPSLNEHPVFQAISQFNKQEKMALLKFVKRTELIFQKCIEMNVPCLLDAEQSYFQSAIDILTQQFQTKFNKEQGLLLNTIQCYLKSAYERTDYEVLRINELKQPLGLKLVRGAYIVQEKKLAKEEGREDPFHEFISQTESCYERNAEILMKAMDKKSHLIIATHNTNSAFKLASIAKSKGKDFQDLINFAQLLGLADHVTFGLNAEGVRVTKYIPYGDLNILIPYLIRRAQETRSAFVSLDMQKKLVWDEIKSRKFFFK